MYPDECDCTNMREIYGKCCRRLVQQLETVHMKQPNKYLVLGCSNTTVNTALRAELGVYQLKNNTGVDM